MKCPHECYPLTYKIRLLLRLLRYRGWRQCVAFSALDMLEFDIPDGEVYRMELLFDAEGGCGFSMMSPDKTPEPSFTCTTGTTSTEMTERVIKFGDSGI